MKKLLFVVLSLFAFAAVADNTITSKEYVDGQVSNLQTQIPAKNTNTVLTNTGTAGEIGEKAIYDTTATYGTQTDALVTAGAFNSAIQNALESEFVCIDWLGDVHDNAHCLLYQIRSATVQTQALPAGYTQLEYITNNGFAYVDTNINQKEGIGIRVAAQFPEHVGNNGYDNFQYAIGAYTAGDYIGIWKPSANVLRMCYRADAKEVSTSDTDVHDIRVNYFNDRKFIFDGQQISNLAETKTITGPTIRLFQTNHPTRAFVGQVSIHHAQITDRDTLVFDGIPVKRNSDSVLGFYDTVSNSFIAGTGTFIAGPVVYF